MTSAIIIPFRDRGIDPHRSANLATVVGYWERYAPVHVVDDGRTGNAQFNRHAAYNSGTRITTADTLCYIEADIIIDYPLIDQAIHAAQQTPRLVVPFESLWHLSEADTIAVRNGADPASFEPVEKTAQHRNAGAANVITRTTLEMAGGWDEHFDGHWYDDDAMKIRFERATGNPTHFIAGHGYHLHHLSASHGDHLTDEDRAATTRNHLRYNQYRTGQRT